MKQQIFKLVLAVVLVAFSLGLVVNAQANGLDTTDAIAGVWTGNMSFSNRNSIERIIFTIPSGCVEGQVCGSMQNLPVQCTWEITFDQISNDVYTYHFSNTLKGGCPAGSAGELKLQSGGTLLRTHTTPQFSAWGPLYAMPGVGK